jgi:hypothetical protein
MLVGKVAQRSVLNGTSSSNDHAWGGVVILNVGFQVTAGQGSDVLLGAQNSPSQTCSLKGSRMKVIQDQFLLLLVDFGHFSQDHVAFALNGGLFQLAIEKNIGKDLNGTANVVLEDFGKVNRLLTGSVGVPASMKK